MSDIRINEEELIQNLIDAGCDNELVMKCIEITDETSHKKILTLLNDHRNKLLSDIHKKQDELYCLDYLMHQLREQNGE